MEFGPESVMTCLPLRCKAVSSSLSKDTAFRIEQEVPSHSLSAPMGVKTFETVLSFVSSANGTGDLWREATSVAAAAAELLQMYTDKFHTTMNSSAFKLYPAPFTLLNVSNRAGRRFIASGKPLLHIFIPISIVDPGSSLQNEVIRDSKETRLDLIY